MNKKHQQAFNKAYVEVIRSSEKSLKLNSKARRYDVVVPLTVVTKAFRKFINIVEKDLKIGKYRKTPTNKAKAAKKQGARK